MTGTSSSTRFIDSNVFVYAFVKPRVTDQKVSEMKEKAREIISRIERVEERIVVTYF